jgi:general secretion pathway protein H
MQTLQTKSFHHNEAGFTLVELLVVLAVIALMTVITSITLNSFSTSWALRRAAQEGRDVVSETRRDAIRTGKPIIVKWPFSYFTTANSSGQQFKPSDRRLSASFIPAFAGAPTHLTIFPDGSSTGGTIRFTLRRNSVDVTTDWLTGLTTTTWPRNPGDG